MSRGARLLIGTLLGAFCSLAACAQESGAYLGGSLGWSKFKEWCDTGVVPAGFVQLSCEDTDTAWKLFGGYQFNRYIALEATYIDWGKATGSADFMGVADASLAQQSMGVAAVGTLPLGPQLAVFAKLGFLRTEQETERVRSTGTTMVEVDETEAHYGFGVRYRFLRNWGVRAEWETKEKLKVDLLSIGAEFRF